jgi:hypothetical protein
MRSPFEEDWMRYVKKYRANYGGQCRSLYEVYGRVQRIGEELAAYCSGDVSYARLDHVAVDLAVMLVTKDEELARACLKCCDKLADDEIIVPVEETPSLAEAA